jgi:hypothetical protein
MIEEGVASGDFRPVDGTLCFFSTIGACDYLFSHQYIIRILYNKDSVDSKLRNALIEHTTDLVLSGIEARGPN